MPKAHAQLDMSSTKIVNLLDPTSAQDAATKAYADTKLTSPMTTLGDIIYGGASGVATRLGAGSNGQVLKLASGIPSWAAETRGANPMTTAGDLIYGGASGVETRLGVGSTGQILTVSGGNPSWATLSAFVQSGNSFGATAVLGTNDNQALHFKTNNTVWFRLLNTGLFEVLSNMDVAGDTTLGGDVTTGGTLFVGSGAQVTGGLEGDTLRVTSTSQFDALANHTINDATTNAVTNVLNLGHNTTGTPATGLGAGLRFRGESSTTTDQDMARISSVWTTVTHASRSADLVFELTRSAAALAERMRLSSGGQLTVTGASSTVTPLQLKAGASTLTAPYFRITDNSNNNKWTVDSDLYWHRYGAAMVMEMTGDTEGGVRLTLRNDTSDQGARFDAFPTDSGGSRAYVDFVFGYNDTIHSADAKMRLQGNAAETVTDGSVEWQWSAQGGSPMIFAVSENGVWIPDAVAEPPAPPSGVILWCDAGVLKAKDTTDTNHTLW